MSAHYDNDVWAASTGAAAVAHARGYGSGGGNGASYKLTVLVVRGEPVHKEWEHVPPLKFWVFKENMHFFV
jgi:hypothetical protein